VKAGVFLSHSSADDALVDKVILFFREFDVLVYADNYDQSLPKPPTVDTAVKLKSRIRDASKIIVLVSSNSQKSRWIPWELGFADRDKGIASIGILPVTSDGSEEQWIKEEYFGLYPRIRSYNDEWKVIDPRDNKCWVLKDWLHKTVE